MRGTLVFIEPDGVFSEEGIDDAPLQSALKARLGEFELFETLTHYGNMHVLKRRVGRPRHECVAFRSVEPGEMNLAAHRIWEESLGHPVRPILTGTVAVVLGDSYILDICRRFFSKR